jgi:hypothetical protein
MAVQENFINLKPQSLNKHKLLIDLMGFFGFFFLNSKLANNKGQNASWEKQRENFPLRNLLFGESSLLWV